MRAMILTLLASFVILTGCAAPKTIYVEKPELYLREPLGITPPPAVVLDDVKIILVKPEGQPAYFKLDPDSYKGLLLNNKQIENWIREAGSRINACENYYTAPIEETQP